MTAAPLSIEFADAHVDHVPGSKLIAAMREEMAALYEGLVFDGATMPKAGAAELGPPGGLFIVGRVQARAICCGGVKRLTDGACEIKRMYVVPPARGRGVARRLLHELEDRARGLGYGTARLDTGPKQVGAQHLYESEGYRAIANFNANPIASFFGEKRLG